MYLTMLHVSHPPHQYISSPDNLRFWIQFQIHSSILIYSAIPLSLCLISFFLCHCVRVTLKSRLSQVESLKSRSLKTCIEKKKKNRVGHACNCVNRVQRRCGHHLATLVLPSQKGCREIFFGEGYGKHSNFIWWNKISFFYFLFFL